MISNTGRPIISSALYPNSLSALLFQLVIVPSRSLLAIASSEDSMIAASRRCSLSASVGLPVGALSLSLKGKILDMSPVSPDLANLIAENDGNELGQNTLRPGIPYLDADFRKSAAQARKLFRSLGLCRQ